MYGSDRSYAAFVLEKLKKSSRWDPNSCSNSLDCCDPVGRLVELQKLLFLLADGSRLHQRANIGLWSLLLTCVLMSDAVSLLSSSREEGGREMGQSSEGRGRQNRFWIVSFFCALSQVKDCLASDIEIFFVLLSFFFA